MIQGSIFFKNALPYGLVIARVKFLEDFPSFQPKYKKLFTGDIYEGDRLMFFNSGEKLEYAGFHSRAKDLYSLNSYLLPIISNQLPNQVNRFHLMGRKEWWRINGEFAREYARLKNIIGPSRQAVESPLSSLLWDCGKRASTSIAGGPPRPKVDFKILTSGHYGPRRPVLTTDDEKNKEVNNANVFGAILWVVQHSWVSNNVSVLRIE